MGVLDTVMLVPLHLVRDEWGHGNVFLSLGLHLHVKVKQPRRVALHFRVVVGQIVYFSVQSFLPSKIDLLIDLLKFFLGGKLLLVQLLWGIEDRGLKISLLPTLVVVVIEFCLLIDSGGILALSCDVTRNLVLTDL